MMRRALLHPLLEQREEQVGLAAELGVDDTLGEPGFVRDGLQGGARVPAGNEDPLGRRQDQFPVSFDLFYAAQPSGHAQIKYRRYLDVNGI
jgi:hypothetical protein